MNMTVMETVEFFLLYIYTFNKETTEEKKHLQYLRNKGSLHVLLSAAFSKTKHKASPNNPFRKNKHNIKIYEQL